MMRGREVVKAYLAISRNDGANEMVEPEIRS